MRASIFKLGEIFTVSSFQMNIVSQENYTKPINPKQARTQWHMHLQLLRHVLSAVIYHMYGIKAFWASQQNVGVEWLVVYCYEY